MRLGALLAVSAVLGGAAPADADVRALAAQDLFGPGPRLDAGRVIWVRQGARSARVFSQPVAGGRPTVAGVVHADVTELAGDRSGIGIVVARRQRPARPEGLRSFPPGVFAGRTDLAPNADLPRAFATDAGLVTIEGAARRLRVVLHPPRAAPRTIALARGADPAHASASGSGLAVPIAPRGLLERVDIIDVASGRVVRRVAPRKGEGLDTEVRGAGLGPDGSLALTVEAGDGSDALLAAGPGEAALSLSTVKDDFGLVAPAAGRVAMVQPAGRGGERVVVLDRARIAFRGPPTHKVRSLAFDGTNVAWSTDSCQYVAVAQAASSRRTDPAGPCIRTELRSADFLPPRVRRRHGRRELGLEVDCLTGPRDRCRLSVVARDAAYRLLGRLKTTVPIGPKRIVWVPLRRGARLGSSPDVRISRIDPGGRTFRELF